MFKERPIVIIAYVVCTVMAVLAVTPFFWVLMTALKPNPEINAWPPHILPEQPTLDHFHRILGIARTTLTARLDRLIQQGFFERVQYQERPPRYEYLLSAKGKALCPVLLTLFDWGKRGMRNQTTDASILHKSCGKPLRILVVCENCREVADPHDAEVMTASGRVSTKSAPIAASPIPLSVRDKAGGPRRTLASRK